MIKFAHLLSLLLSLSLIGCAANGEIGESREAIDEVCATHAFNAFQYCIEGNTEYEYCADFHDRVYDNCQPCGGCNREVADGCYETLLDELQVCIRAHAVDHCVDLFLTGQAQCGGGDEHPGPVLDPVDSNDVTQEQ